MQKKKKGLQFEWPQFKKTNKQKTPNFSYYLVNNTFHNVFNVFISVFETL